MREFGSLMLDEDTSPRLAQPPYQLNSPTGLRLELSKRALKEPPKVPLKWSPSVLALGQLRG